jgi:hypothetical protein
MEDLNWLEWLVHGLGCLIWLGIQEDFLIYTAEQSELLIRP